MGRAINLLFIFTTAVATFLPTHAKTDDCQRFYNGKPNRLVFQRMPIANGDFKLIDDGKGNLKVVLKSGLRLDVMPLISGGKEFPRNYGITSRDEIVVGTSSTLSKFKVIDGSLVTIESRLIHPGPSFSEWVFSPNGRYAVGVFSEFKEGYRHLLVYDFESSQLNKSKVFAITDTTLNPAQLVSISDQGNVLALTVVGKTLPLLE